MVAGNTFGVSEFAAVVAVVLVAAVLVAVVLVALELVDYAIILDLIG